MAKTIKFNLILDNNPVRNIDDLQNNFSIEDVIQTYNNGLLQRWLSVRGYNDYLDKVNRLEVEDNESIIKELIRIFEIECDERKIREGLAIIDYIDERRVLFEKYNNWNHQFKNIVDDYHSGYNSIINNIIENKDNMGKIKANIKEIEENYMELFKLNYRDLYNNLIENAPLAVFAIVMNARMRSYFISSENSSSSTDLIYGKIQEFVANKSLVKERFGNKLKIFKGNTEEYWKDIEPKEKMFMIIRLEPGNFVRNSGKFGEELNSVSVNNVFPLLNGIDYKSKYEYDELLYMEV